MPVRVGAQIPVPQENKADIIPDVKTDVPLVHAALISMETPLEWPLNFDELPTEEQEKIKARYRFLGIRCRADIKDRTIPMNRETMDLP